MQPEDWAELGWGAWDGEASLSLQVVSGPLVMSSPTAELDF